MALYKSEGLRISTYTNGVSFKNIKEYYKATNSNTSENQVTKPDNTWSDSISRTSFNEQNKFLWNIEEIISTNPDGTENTKYTVPEVIQIWTGRTVSRVISYYATSSSMTNAPTGAPTLTNNGNTLNAPSENWNETLSFDIGQAVFLWETTVTQYASTDANGHNKYEIIPAHVIGYNGRNGDDGKGVTIKGTAYLKNTIDDNSIGASFIIYSDSNCNNVISSSEDNDAYLIQGYLFVYDGSEDNTFVCVGKIQGPQGKQGRGVSQVINYYLASSKSEGIVSGEEAEGEEWVIQPLPQLTADKPYLWNYEQIIYSDMTSTTTEATIIGYYTEDGRGIEEIQEIYCLTEDFSCDTPDSEDFSEAVIYSDGEPEKKKWYKNTPPTSATNKYLWNSEQIVYTDKTSTILAPALMGTHGETGPSAKDLNLVASSYALIREYPGAAPKNNIILTAHLMNIDLNTDQKVQWKKDGEDWGAATTQLTYEVDSPGTYSVRTVYGAWQDSVIITDVIDGEPSISIVLSNPNMTFHKETTGEYEECEVIVYEGSKQLTTTADSGPRFSIVEKESNDSIVVDGAIIKVSDPSEDGSCAITVSVVSSSGNTSTQDFIIYWKVISDGIAYTFFAEPASWNISKKGNIVPKFIITESIGDNITSTVINGVAREFLNSILNNKSNKAYGICVKSSDSSPYSWFNAAVDLQKYTDIYSTNDYIWWNFQAQETDSQELKDAIVAQNLKYYYKVRESGRVSGVYCNERITQNDFPYTIKIGDELWDGSDIDTTTTFDLYVKGVKVASATVQTVNDGDPAKDLNLLADNYFFVKKKNGAIVPTIINFTTQSSGLTGNYSWTDADNSSATGSSNTLTYNSGHTYPRTVKVARNGLEDSVTIGYIEEAQDGEDAIGIMLTNPSMTFNSKTSTSETCSAIVMSGTTSASYSATVPTSGSDWKYTLSGYNSVNSSGVMTINKPNANTVKNITITVYKGATKKKEQTIGIQCTVVEDGDNGDATVPIVVYQVHTSSTSAPTKPTESSLGYWDTDIPEWPSGVLNFNKIYLYQCNGFKTTKANGAISYTWSEPELFRIKNRDDNYVKQLKTFNELTNNGTIQGLRQDSSTGEVYINASYINSGIMNADLITAGTFSVGEGDNSKFRASIEDDAVKIGGFDVSSTSLSAQGSDSRVYVGTDKISLGSKFEVNNQGYLTSTSGNIGGWQINENSLASQNNNAILYSGAENQQYILQLGKISKNDLIQGSPQYDVDEFYLTPSSNLVQLDENEKVIKATFSIASEFSNDYTPTRIKLITYNVSDYLQFEYNGETYNLITALSGNPTYDIINNQFTIIFSGLHDKDYGKWMDMEVNDPNYQLFLNITSYQITYKYNGNTTNYLTSIDKRGYISSNGLTADNLDITKNATANKFISRNATYYTQMTPSEFSLTKTVNSKDSLLMSIGVNNQFPNAGVISAPNGLGIWGPVILKPKTYSFDNIAIQHKYIYLSNTGNTNTYIRANQHSSRVGDEVEIRSSRDVALYGDMGTYLGQSNYNSSFQQFRGTWSNADGGNVNVSDARLKHNIESLDNRYETFFDNIQSTRFIYNTGTSNRYHTGYITQNIQQALNEANLSESEFAGIVTLHEPKEDGHLEDYNGLRYDEFVPLNTWQIQKLKPRMTAAEEKIHQLKDEISLLRIELKNLKNS